MILFSSGRKEREAERAEREREKVGRERGLVTPVKYLMSGMYTCSRILALSSMLRGWAC